MIPIDTFFEDCPPVLIDMLATQSMAMAQKKEHFAQAPSCLGMVPQTLGTALEKFLYIINSINCKGFEGQLVECKSCYRASTKKSNSRDLYKTIVPEKNPNIMAERAAMYFQPGCSYGIGFDKNSMDSDREKVCYKKKRGLISKMGLLKTHQNCTNQFCLNKMSLKNYMLNSTIDLLHHVNDVTDSSAVMPYRSSKILLARMLDFYLKFTLKSSSEPAFIDTRSLTISFTTGRSTTNKKSANKNGSEANNKSKDCQESDELHLVDNKSCKKCIVIKICDMGEPTRSCFKRSSTRQDISSDEVDFTEDFTKRTFKEKKVKFAPPDKLCEVHPMIKWSYAYQAARKGPWEMHARDRDRFRWRIFRVEQDIKHVFDQKHRSKIYRDRFENL